MQTTFIEDKFRVKKGHSNPSFLDPVEDLTIAFLYTLLYMT
ncbi:hypothetical protein NMY3_01593 [Candidatus Nitrosocosmicus oleophilus]|uniref:Uncharacterized protein n=1 Tax=Candidatus Nitrosocosmicus oleophilus TaxID=1353260 RepID=A0A654LZE4_9ARCH|nr:hypothetical protein NMY3_01593 [Candidatus Nitrosocosmicus oleophilus]